MVESWACCNGFLLRLDLLLRLELATFSELGAGSPEVSEPSMATGGFPGLCAFRGTFELGC
jgi:hypothetical protein